MTGSTTDTRPTVVPRVLVVDDDPTIHALVRAFLRPIDAAVTTALDGTDALEQMRRNLPDIVVLDYDMPGRNGLEVLDEIRRDARMRSAWKRRRLMNDLKQAARLDGLTGLPNRSLLTARLADMLQRTGADRGRGFAVFYLDFDRFTVINDIPDAAAAESIAASGRVSTSAARCRCPPMWTAHGRCDGRRSSAARRRSHRADAEPERNRAKPRDLLNPRLSLRRSAGP